MLPPDVRRRVVVTGLGLVTPLGCGTELIWKKLLQGQSGIQSLKDKPEFKDFPCQVAGLVPIGSGPGELSEITANELRTMTQDMVVSSHVTEQALKDASWMPEKRSEEGDLTTGVSFTTSGFSSAECIKEAACLIQQGMYRKISPFMVTKSLTNMISGLMSINFKLKGPNHSVVTTCSSGLHTIGDSAHMILRGACDVMVAGAVDFGLPTNLIAGLCRANALSTKFNDEPLKASRPFDANRDGFVLSQGAGVVILEELEHAKHRNANIYAEILGYGMSSDAHLTQESGDGIARAIKDALRDACIAPEHVGHVNAHATSSPMDDLVETNAIKQVFGESSDVLVYAPKGALGNSLGASSMIEAALAVLSVQKGVVPPNLNLEEKSSEFSLNYVTGSSVDWERKNGQPKVAIASSFTYGGSNAALCIGEYDHN